jgi:hypothetical protein
VPNNHSKYRTSLLAFRRGTLVYLQRYHCGPGVEPADSVAGEAIHLRMRDGKERLDCPGSLRLSDSGQYDFPLRGLKLWRFRHGQITDLDHVNSVRQGCVEPSPHGVGIQPGGEGDLQKLGLAGSAGRRPA